MDIYWALNQLFDGKKICRDDWQKFTSFKKMKDGTQEPINDYIQIIDDKLMIHQIYDGYTFDCKRQFDFDDLKSTSWQEYIEPEISFYKVLGECNCNIANAFFASLKEKYPNIVFPAITTRDNIVSFTWSYYDYLIEIQFENDKYDWYARNRITGEDEGTEDPIDDLVPEKLYSWFEKIKYKTI
jgi:hypothetical protein